MQVSSIDTKTCFRGTSQTKTYVRKSSHRTYIHINHESWTGGAPIYKSITSDKIPHPQTLRTCKYFHFKTTFMCARSIAGVPSSQALPGYLITAPPFVCVPAVIGVLACGFQTKKNQINIWLQHYWTAASPTGLTERGEATGPTGDQAESKRASSGRLDLLLTFSCFLPRATKYHSKKIRAFRISRHFW